MTGLLTEQFEGTAGNSITASNAAYGTVFFSSSADASAVFDSTTVESGNSGRITTTANGSSVLLGRSITATGLLYQRLYGRFDASDGDIILIQVEAGGSVVSQLSWETADNTWDLKDAFTSVASTTAPTPTGTLYRVETEIDVSAGTQALRLYVGSNVHGTSPDETISGAFSGAQPDTMLHGIAASRSNVDMYLDAVRASDSDWIGTAQQPGALYAYVSGAWQHARRYRYDGSAWS